MARRLGIVLIAVAALLPVQASAHPNACSGPIDCIRHCNTYHRGLTDRATCVVTHLFPL